MNKMVHRQSHAELSYKIYQEIGPEICAPIEDPDLNLQLRIELYKSKLIYLYNIHEQCFRMINLTKKDPRFEYTEDDLINVQQAIMMTKVYLNDTMLLAAQS